MMVMHQQDHHTTLETAWLMSDLNRMEWVVCGSAFVQ